MESLPDNILIKYNPDTLTTIRKMYNLDKPCQVEEVIDLLDAWIKKQSHFVRKEYSREYLERVIILSKGSVERAKTQLENICTLRTLLPHFFEKFDARNDYAILKGFSHKSLLPKLTKENLRILLSKYNFNCIKNVGELSKIMLFDYFHNILVCEYLKANDYSAGVIIVVDIGEVNVLDVILRLDLLEMKQIFTIFLDGYGMRVIHFFFITLSKTINVGLKLVKQMVSEKVGKRIQVLKEVKELYEYIPKELLPSDYGGLENSLDQLNDALTEELSSKPNVNYFKEMSQCRTIESLRTSSSKYNDYFSDIAGTFRTLSVD